MELKIVSGGQTGADRAALDWAIEKGISHGGWCPAGRLAEDGQIGIEYLLEEMPDGGGYRRRTKANVRDSDATLIVSLASELTGGSKETALFAHRLDKPCLHVHPGMDWQESLAAWDPTWEAAILNVAGPRGTREPEVGKFVREALDFVLEKRDEQRVLEELRIGYREISVRVDSIEDFPEKVRVVEPETGLFQVVETSDIPIANFFFLFGDRFSAAALPDGTFEFLDWADRETFVHVLWILGMFLGGPAIEDGKILDYAKQEFVRHNYVPYHFRSAVMRSGGMWELDSAFGNTILSAHFPAAAEESILGRLKTLAPALSEERMLRIRSGLFEWPEGW